MTAAIERLQKRLEGKADCALVTDDINRRYLTGMKSSSGYVLIFPEKAYLLVDFRYLEKARASVSCCEVIEQKRAVLGQLRELMQRHGAKTCAVESMSLTLERLAFFQKIKEVEFLTDDTLSKALYELRTVKEPEEIAKIKMAQHLAEEALSHLLEQLSAGMTEREVAMALDFHMLSAGAEAVSFETIALTGAHTSMPHGVPDDRKIQKGDFVLMDFGAVVDGYHSDMTRTVCVGNPTEEMRTVYQIVQTAQNKALSFARPGITGGELDAAARNEIASQGYGDNFGHSLGHGVGMEIHEYPIAASQRKEVLSSGNIVTVEPGIYLPGKFGVRIEDLVQITEEGNEDLTEWSNELICL